MTPIYALALSTVIALYYPFCTANMRPTTPP
jgi:hypothetical protein